MRIFKCGAVLAGADNAYMEDRFVAVDGGTIVAIEKELNGIPNRQDAEIVDCSDCMVIPGLINSHTHLSLIPGEGDQLAQMGRRAEVNILKSIPNLKADLYSGVTTTRVMCEENSIDFYLRDAIREGLIQGPRILTCGTAITSVNGHGYVHTSSDGIEEVVANCRRNLERGADFIKIFVGGGISTNAASLDHSTYALEEIQAAVDTAKAYGKYVAAHVHGGRGVDLCIEAGVKSIEHGSMLNAGQIEAIKKRGMWVTGTFSILFHPDGIAKTDMQKDPEIREKVLQGREIVKNTFGQIISNQVKVSLGTDSMHGLLPYEAEKYVEFGASAQEAIDAMTCHAARACEIEDTHGTIEVGKAADFVILDGNPLKDITELCNVVQVYKSGIEQICRF